MLRKHKLLTRAEGRIHKELRHRVDSMDCKKHHPLDFDRIYLSDSMIAKHDRLQGRIYADFFSGDSETIIESTRKVNRISRKIRLV